MLADEFFLQFFRLGTRLQLAIHTCMVMCGSRNKLQHVMALLDRILHSDQESVPERGKRLCL